MIMTDSEVEIEVESLMEQIKFDNRGLEHLPFGELFSHICKCILRKNDYSSELRSLFKDSKKKQWNLIKTGSGKDFYDEYKEYKYLLLFELCRGNFTWPRNQKPEELEGFIEIIRQIIGSTAKNLVKEMVSWHRDNPKDNIDLIDFIFYNEYAYKYSNRHFIRECPELIERITSSIWEILNEKEKLKFSYISLYYFEEQMNSLKDINFKNKLEKYFDSYMMEQLNIETRELKRDVHEGMDIESRNALKEQYNGVFEGNTLIYTIGKLEHGHNIFNQAMFDKNEAINKFVLRKIGHPLFIKDDANDEEFIDYIINVELNKSLYSYKKLEKIYTDTDADSIWKIICTLNKNRVLYTRVENVFFKRDDLVEKIENANIRFSESFEIKYLEIDRKTELFFSIKTEKAFSKIAESLNKMSNDADIFSMLKYLSYNYKGYEAVLVESRKLQINELLKKGILQEAAAGKLIIMAESEKTNCYAWSDNEIKSWLPETDLEKLHVNLESELMVRIFEISILSVIKHKPNKLEAESLDFNWQQPFIMRIFNKSYADRPSIWAKHLLKIAEDWKGNENMLIRICFALGHLREPLGGKVPISLQKIADKQANNSIKKLILTQRNLFNRENFNKGHHKTPFKRVELCKEELIEGVKEEADS